MLVYFSKRISVHRNCYGIQKREQNLLSLTLNVIYGFLLISSLLFDQIKNVFLEVFHKNLGTELTYQLWLYGFIFENISNYKF